MMRSSAISFLLLLVLCSSPSISADAQNDFTAGLALNLYKTICSKNAGKNLFYSPLSVSTAFGMVHLGAAGNTKAQLRTVLKLNSFNSDDGINARFRSILGTLNQQEGNYTVYLVNRLFGSDASTFNTHFLENCHEYFNSTMKGMNFRQQPEESRIHINDWVSNQTNGKIKDLLVPGNVKESTTLVIVNAVYFKATWKYPFDPRDTNLGSFRISSSESVQMNMMRLTGKYLNYYNSSELSCEVLELPFLGDQASMFIVLPRDVGGLPMLEDKLTAETLMSLLSKVSSTKVIVTLPRFTLDQSIPLKKYLQLLGMIDVFDSAKSDLSGITVGRLYASDAAHKAFVNVNEFGVEAAAATAVPILPGSAPTTPVDFKVDRPFLFLIKAKETNAILFLGRLVRDPTSNETLGVFGEPAALTDNNPPPASGSTSLAVWMPLLFVSSLLVY